jgi:membrane protease YdiL (CAAX protease family)
MNMDEPKPDLPGDLEIGPRPHDESSDSELPPVPLSLEERVHGTFLGPDGLRAGWRFLLYAAMWEVFFSLLDRLMNYVQPQGAPGIWQEMVVESERLVAAVVPAFIMAGIEKRRFGVYGMPLRGAFGKLFWAGALWGIVSLTGLLLAIHGAGDFTFNGLALHGGRIFKFAAFWGLLFLLVGFFEEFLMRGYSQFTLTRGMGFWPAALMLSALFAALHLRNQGETWIGLLGVAAIGLFFCLTLRRTGNLWFAVGFHASWDWSESFLYSVPDSGGMVTGHLLKSSLRGSRWLTGGSVGPEGSVLLFVAIAVTWVTFDRVYPEIKYRIS